MPPLVALLGGTGRLGPGLALRLALAGVPVVIGSRDRGRGARAAAEVSERVAALGGGASVAGEDNVAAAEACAVAMVTVPHTGQRDLLPALAAPLAGKVVVSTAVPVIWEDGRPRWDERMPRGAAAEVADLLPRSRVVAAFHTLSSWLLARPDRGIDSDVIVTGDDPEAKGVVMDLVGTLPGARPVDGGDLTYAVHCEQLTILLLSINRLHRSHSGIVVTDLPGRR